MYLREVKDEEMTLFKLEIKILKDFSKIQLLNLNNNNTIPISHQKIITALIH